MVCKQCAAIETQFDEKVAARELKKYLKKGPAKSTRVLTDALKRQGIEGMTLLDIGGGIGAIQRELMADGVLRTTNVDASRAYVEQGRKESERIGLADQISYQHGNFVDLASDVTAADIVTLDRVICCYPDMIALTGLSAEHARKMYGLVYLRDTWWIRAVGGVLMAINDLVSRSGFRAYIHRSANVERVVSASGLQPRFHQNVGFWQVAVYVRA